MVDGESRRGRKPERQPVPLDLLLHPVCLHTRMQLAGFSPLTRSQLQLALAGRLLAKASAGLIDKARPKTVASLVTLGAEVEELLSEVIDETVTVQSPIGQTVDEGSGDDAEADGEENG